MNNCLDFYEMHTGNVVKMKYLYYLLDNESLISLLKTNTSQYKFVKIIYKIIASRYVHILGFDYFLDKRLNFGSRNTKEKYSDLLSSKRFQHIQNNKALVNFLMKLL